MFCHCCAAIKKSRQQRRRDRQQVFGVFDRWTNDSGTESCRLDEPNLIAAGGEFTSLITLNDHAAAGLDAYHSGTDPAKSG